MIVLSGPNSLNWPGREPDFERRPLPEITHVINSSIMSRDNLVHDGKSQSTAERFRGAKRLKHLQSFRDACARVADLENILPSDS